LKAVGQYLSGRRDDPGDDDGVQSPTRSAEIVSLAMSQQRE